ncbi:MAG: 30S ribosomal protein S20 [Candidatus Magasanikbacteria bacterium]|nr:30S ribosomal protein S20 [Candidatus Magasanikbacteria bacterium]
MPNKAAGRKALRQTKKHFAWNTARKEAFKTAIKKALKAASGDEAKKLVVVAQKALDKAAKRGVIKKNAAARKISRLMKKVAALKK